jgi:hypothetical protein
LLTELELKRFDKFLGSPFFNESEILLEMHRFIQAFAPSFEAAELNKQDLWRHIYPGENYIDSRLRHFMSRLLHLLYRFLAINQFEENGFEENRQLLAALRNHRAEKAYQKTYKKIRDGLEPEGTETYLKEYLLDEELNQFYSVSSLVTVHNIDSSLQQSAQNLDLFYLVNKLRYFCSVINYKRVLKLEHKNLLMEEILDIAQREEYAKVPAVRIYFLILQTLMEPDEDHWFRDLLSALLELQQEFSHEELRGMYVFAQNYCIRKANQGQTSYLTDLFNIYKRVIEAGIIFSDGQFSAATYKNIVANALRLKEYEWVEQFIHTYNEKLPEDDRENAFKYNLARLHFERKEYDEVISLLQQVAYSDVFYSLDSRSILLKTYYELDEFESMHSLIASFRTFLRRNKVLSEAQKKGYMNLIKYTSQASKVRPRDKERVAKLKQDIETASPIADVGWLKEKVAEFS